MASGVWLVTGVQAAGKTTVADLLARQFERGVHVRGGQFYRWAVRGWVHPGDARAAEARRLLDLRYRLSALVAGEYCAAGFTTVVQDNIFGADVLTWLRAVRARPRYLVVLRPSAAAVRARDEARRESTGKVAYRPGEFTVEGLDAELSRTPGIGLWLDTSAQTPEQTLSEILRRRSEAELPKHLLPSVPLAWTRSWRSPARGRDGGMAALTPPFEADERATLTAFLDRQRATLAVKCDGLTEDQLRQQAVPPSSLSLLGIVRHMAEVERNWFRPVLGGEPMSLIFGRGTDWQASFRDVPGADVAEAFEAWRAECDHARALVAAAPSLDVKGFRIKGYISLRWVLAHMIEEYARHNGHADLLRERLDGATGEW